MKKIAVTGAMGFIGSHVLDELKTRGYMPIIFDHHKRSLSEYPQDCEVFLGDVRDPVAMTELAAHSDGIIHLAAVLGTQETIMNPRPAAESNLMGGLNFLEAITQYKIPGVYIAVGNHWMNNPYSITKNMIERFCHMYAADRSAKVNIVRAVNAYGERQLAFTPFANSKVRKITPSLVCRALSGMPMELYGGGVQVSDMVYVGDVAKALVNALESAERGEVLNYAIEIGPTEHTTIKQVAELVNKIIERKGYKPVKIESLPMRPGEKVGEPVKADNKTLRAIGLHPDELMPLEAGMELTIDWFIKNEGKTWTKPN
jgi:UDP-glucose 4-epimerase